MSEIIFKNTTLINDRYRIHKFVDEGGMQQVYDAYDERLQRHVALKTPINDSGKKRFQASAEYSAKVTHPNVAKTLDFFDWKGRQFLIEELIEGSNLRKRYDAEFGFMDPNLACYILHRLARGVAASHHVKVFHRDLKPSNIMVSSEPLPLIIKITDFGIAKLAEEEFKALPDTIEDEKTITATLDASRTMKGAFPYMSPELLQKENPGLPSDIWALGAIGYELLTGTKPFGSSGFKVIAKIVSGKPPETPSFKNNNAHFQELNQALWKLILRCLEPDPAKRITADDLVVEFGKLCYSCSARSTGAISSMGIKGNPNVGLIVDDGGNKTFFHQDSYYGDKPSVGQAVSYSAYPGTPLERAHPILALKNH